MTTGFLKRDFRAKSRGKNPVVIPCFQLRKKREQHRHSSRRDFVLLVWCFVIVYSSFINLLCLIHRDSTTVRGTNPGEGPGKDDHDSPEKYQTEKTGTG